jgi:hypothetical protein
MHPDRNSALERVRQELESREPGSIGLGIEKIVSATIDSEPDEELVDLVRSAMSSRTDPITMPELVDGILNLQNWREYQT